MILSDYYSRYHAVWFPPERIYALVIGIDKYQTAPLVGCEKDARAVIDYLTEDLEVPSENIKLLVNENATRKAILDDFFKHFIENPAIKGGDAFLFYFAGHGGRSTRPDGWPACEHDKVETICPYDVKEEHGIPDRTLSALMRKLAHKKGNNITAIFDSCHSGGIGRDANVGVRTYPSNDSLPSGLDEKIWSNPEGSELPGMYGAMASFVLLAACQADEQARETDKGGIFTTALLDALRDGSFASMTYNRLAKKLSKLKHPDPSVTLVQNPHCEGKHKYCRLFSLSEDRADDPGAFIMTMADGECYIEIGTIFGVVEGTEFTPTGEHSNVVLVAKTVYPFRCLVRPRPLRDNLQTLFPYPSWAKISNRRVKWLKVKLTPPNAFPNIVHNKDTLFSIVDTDGQLEVIRDAASSTAQVVRKDVLLRKCPSPLSVDITTEYLNRAAHFHFFLYYSQTASLPPITVTLHSSELRGSDFDQERNPTDDNLMKASTSNKIAGVASIYYDKSVLYCLTLTSKAKPDLPALFPYVFFFDPYEYAIELLYHPQSEKNGPLNGPGSTVTIGYGAFGTKPFRLTLPAGIDSDSGFIKIFVSNQYVNMRGVELLPGGRPTLTFDDGTGVPFWGALTYRVDVRR